jgi:hypothetical protein
VSFSHSAGFYSEAFNLELTAPEGAVIYYTLDGSTPTVGSTRYSGAIAVTIPASVDVFTINTFAVLGGESSPVRTRSFVRGRDVSRRFSADTLIFTLNSDPHGLNNSTDGIFTDSGAQLRGRESEREVYVEMFDSTGNRLINQRAGMRVKGGYSRTHSQRSIELYARDDYGDSNRFDFPFFGDDHNANGELINRYRRVRLRNGGSDREFGFIRDELGATLLRQAGQPNTQQHVPAAVFVNGEYYGVSWLKTPRTENHLSRIYGGRTDGFEIVDGGESARDRTGGGMWGGTVSPIQFSGEPRGADDLNALVTFAREGITDRARFEEFTRRVDLDNFIRYYAMQIYIDNVDWPNHNIEMWRYFPTDEERSNPNLHPYLRDGRWRVLPHDLEASWGLWDVGLYNGTIENSFNKNTLNELMRTSNVPRERVNGQFGSAFLNAILSREDTRAKFANTMVDLIEGAFAPANVERVLDDLITKITPELTYASRIEGLLRRTLSSGWGTQPRQLTFADYQANWGEIRQYARGRPNAVYSFLNSELSFSQTNRMTVALTVSAGGSVMMNSRPVETVGAESRTVTGNYYAGTTIELTVTPYPGFIVGAVEGAARVGTSNVYTTNRAGAVRVSFAPDPVFSANGSLQITAIRASGSADPGWIELTNNTGRTISAAGMFLADGGNLTKWEFPALNVTPGQTVRIATANNNAPSGFAAQTNFNLVFGERLRLVAPDETVSDSVDVSFMRANQVQRRGSDGKWRISAV